MLKSLSIKNYALIDDLSVDFNNGLSIITGETGAGKSILVGGLSLILGKRADISVVKDISKKCIIEAVFDVGNYNLKDILLLTQESGKDITFTYVTEKVDNGHTGWMMYGYLDDQIDKVVIHTGCSLQGE